MPDVSGPSRQATFVVGLALILAGLWTAFTEARPYVNSGVIDAERFAALSAGEIHPGYSNDSRYLIMQLCTRTMTSAYTRLQPSSGRDQVAHNCRAMAQQIVAQQPADSFALFVGALASQILGEKTEAVDWLGRSQDTGANEQWVAELRVAVGEALLPDLTPVVRSQHDRDLRMLVVSERGIRSIAKRYVDVPDFRERITAIVETLPPADQERFLGHVRDAATEAIGS